MNNDIKKYLSELGKKSWEARKKKWGDGSKLMSYVRITGHKNKQKAEDAKQKNEN